jgi:hypothetical protein
VGKQDGDFHWSLTICSEHSLLNSQKKYIADCLSQYHLIKNLTQDYPAQKLNL